MTTGGRADASAAWRNARTALVAPVESRLVPKEPTDEMLTFAVARFRERFGGNDELTDVVGADDLVAVWRAMLAAAPSIPSSSDYDRAVEDCAVVAESFEMRGMHPVSAAMGAGWNGAVEKIAAAIRELKEKRE